MSDTVTITPEKNASSGAPCPCPICGGAPSILFSGQSWAMKENGRLFRYVRCPACRLMYSDPQPTSEELEYLYSERYDYAWFIKRALLKRWQGMHRAARMQTLIPQHGLPAERKRLLDIGCGHGWFVQAMRDAGWQAEGLDLLSDDLVKAAADRGVTLHKGSPLGHSLGDRQFDVITMWHVLEHITTPQVALEGVAKLLAPGGLCIIAVPNGDAAGLTQDGLRWVWCQKPFIHPWHHTAGTLRMLLPPSLDFLRATSRDVWDAQWFESGPVWRLLMKLIYFACRAPAKLLRMAGVKGADKFFDEAQFLMEEALRLESYAAYLLLRPFLRDVYEDRLLGSELMMIAQKRDA